MEFPVLHNRFPSATCLRGLSDPHLSSALRVEEGDGEKVPCQLLREASDKQPHLKSVDESREKEKKKESFFFFKFPCESVSCSVVSDSLRPHVLLARQAPLSMEFSRQEYWGGLPRPSPGDLPDPGI